MLFAVDLSTDKNTNQFLIYLKQARKGYDTDNMWTLMIGRCVDTFGINLSRMTLTVEQLAVGVGE